MSSPFIPGTLVKIIGDIPPPGHGPSKSGKRYYLAAYRSNSGDHTGWSVMRHSRFGGPRTCETHHASEAKGMQKAMSKCIAIIDERNAQAARSVD